MQRISGPALITRTRAPGVLSPAQAAEHLGLSLPALQQLVDRGELWPMSDADDGAPGFASSALDDYLSEQRTRAIVTGKLTLPLQSSVDVPALLATMVSMRDERRAAEALASEAALLAGARCPAALVLRADDVLQTMRLLAGSAVPGRELTGIATAALDAAAPGGGVDFQELPVALQQALSDHQSSETTDVAALLRPILDERAPALIAQLGLRGALACPLLRIGPVRWVLVVLLQDAPEALAARTREAIEALGIQASVALEAVRLRNDVLQRANRAEALYSTVRMLARAEDSGGLLENVASQAARLLSADGAVVLIVDRDGTSFTAGATTGLGERSVAWPATLSAEYLIGCAAGMTRPLQVTDAARAAALNLPRLAGERDARSAICAPIIHKGILLGAIEIYGARPRSFGEEDQSLLVAFAHQAGIAIDAMRGQEVRRRALLGAVEALASANEARDGFTGQHCKQLARLAMTIARSLGFAEEEVERIALAAALHDIGKIAVPDAILRKPDKLTSDEREIINLHPATGEAIVARVPELQDVARMIGAHQERWDGDGYPRGLAGDAIPIGARIIAVVDTYAALVENRPYRDGAPHDDALRELERSSGSQLDPLVVDAFVRLGEQVRELMAADETDVRDWPLGSGARGTHGLPPGTDVAGNHAQQTRDPGSELTALRAAVHAIAAERDPRAMYERLRAALTQLLEYDALLVLTTDPTPLNLRHLPELRQSAWFPPVGNPVEGGVVETVARLKRSLWINDLLEYASERDLPLPEDATLVGTPRSIVAVPLVVDDEFRGVLTLQALHPAAYDRHHVELLEEIALHLALALHFGESRALADPPRRPPARRMADRLVSATTAGEVATLFIEETRQALPCENCVVYLLQAGQPVLAGADDGWSAEERDALARQPLPHGQGLVWAAVDGGAPLVIPDLVHDPRAAGGLRAPQPGESGLALPLTSKGQTVAVTVLTRSGEPFTAADAAALAVIAAPVAGALAEILAGEIEQQHVRDLAALARTLARIDQPASDADVLANVVKALVGELGFRRAALYRRAGDTLELLAGAGDEPAPARLLLDQGPYAATLRDHGAKRYQHTSAVPGTLTAELVAPVTLPGGVDGLLVAGCGRERVPGAWELALVEQIARQLSATRAHAPAWPATVEQPAAIDGLTGLLGQQAFTERLTRAVADAAARDEPLALLFLDLDHFKLANDAFGHRFGDELLRYLGEQLPRELPETALVGRYGGEEFVIMLPSTPLTAAEQLGNQLREAMAAHEFTTSAGHHVILSMSVGVAAREPGADGPQDAAGLLHAADRAMYLAKRRGRNRVVSWSATTRDALARLH